MSITAWDFFDSVESRHDVSHVKFAGLPVWSIIRMHVCFNVLPFGGVLPSGYRFKRILTMLRSMVYGVWDIIKPLSVVIISNSGLRVVHHNQYYDRCFERISSHCLGQALVIERPSPEHHPKSLCASERLVSFGFFYFLSLFISVPSQSIEGQAELDDLFKELGVSMDVPAFMMRFYRLYRVFLWFFKFKKPKLVMVTCYYGELAAVIAARTLRIRVIELQHGHLYGGHPAYFPRCVIPAICIPDEFWAYSETDRIELMKLSVYSGSLIRVVGHDYLSMVRDMPFSYPDLLEFKTHYQSLVCVTSQYVIESELVKFICEVADRTPEIGYLFIPRGQFGHRPYHYRFPSNVKVVTTYNTYGVIQQCHFHATVFSTCAVEAPYLGVPTILINLEGWSKRYFKEVLTDERLFCFVNNCDEFVSMVSSSPFEHHDRLLELSRPYMSDFRIPDGVF